MRLEPFVMLLGLGCLLAGREASAGEGDGMKVGLASAGGEVAGLLIGGGLGLAGGLGACNVSDSWECMAPIVTTPAGAIVGGIAGAAGGGALGARSLGMDHRKVRRWSLAAGAAGLGVSALGVSLSSGAVMAACAVGGAVGMPIAAGLAARDASPSHAASTPRVQVGFSPTFGLNSYGVKLDGTF